METNRRLTEIQNVEHKVCNGENACVKNRNYNTKSYEGVQKNTQPNKTKTTNCFRNPDSNSGYIDLSWSYTSSSKFRGFLGNSERLRVIAWTMANLMAILVKRSDAFPQGSSIVANFEQTYCQPQVEALNRAPNHVDPRLCGGTCTPISVTNGRYTIHVNTTEYSIHNVQVDIRATSGANILGFAVVAVSDKNITAGRWVIQEVQNPTVTRATCDALLQGQVIFHARASRDRSRVTVTWDSRRTNFGRIFFRAWIVQQHSQVFVLDSEPLTNRLNASAFASLESKFTDILSGISLQQSAPPSNRQQSAPPSSRQQPDSVLINSTTQAPSTTSVTQNSVPFPTTVTENSTKSSSASVTQISTELPTSTSTPHNSTPSSSASVTQDSTTSSSTSVTQISTELPTSTSAPHNSTPSSSTSVTQKSTTPSSTSVTKHLEISTQSPTSSSMTQQPLTSTALTSTFSSITSPTIITNISQVQPGIHMSNSSRKKNSNNIIADNAGIPSLTSLKEFEAAFSSRLSNGYKINDEDPFGEFNRASYQLTDFIPESNARRFTNTSLDPFRTELVFETKGHNLSRDVQPINRPSSVQMPDATADQGQLPGRISASSLQQDLGSSAGQLQEGPRQFQVQVPWEQRQFSGGFPGQLPEQQGPFPGQPSFQQQGQFPGQPPSQQLGQFPGQPPSQQLGQFPGQPPSQQLGQFPGQPPSQQLGQFPGQPPSQQLGQFPGQPPSQQLGQFPGQPPSQQLGQFPGQPPSQQLRHFSGQIPFQQKGQFPGQPSFQQFPGQPQQQVQFPGQPQQPGQFPGQPQQQGQFPGQPHQQGQFPGQPSFQQQGQFPGQPQQQGQFPGQPSFQQQGQFPGQSSFQQQGQFPGQSSFQPQGQFPAQATFQQRGQFPSQFPWLQQGQFPNQAQRQADAHINNLGFSSTFSGTPFMPNIAANNPGSNGLNNFQNQAQFGGGPTGQSAWNTPGSFGNQGSAPFQNGAFGQNVQLQMINSALTGQSNNLPNQNGGSQTNQFGGFLNMFGGNPTSRLRGNNRSSGFWNAARMFG